MFVCVQVTGGVQSQVTLQLENLTDSFAAFKIKTTAPRSYLVKPSSGVIGPKKSQEINILLIPLFEPPKDPVADRSAHSCVYTCQSVYMCVSVCGWADMCMWVICMCVNVCVCVSVCEVSLVRMPRFVWMRLCVQLLGASNSDLF